MKYIIYADGASRGNPGPASCGAVAYGDSKNVLFEVSEAIGKATNNVAEYRAVIFSLEKLKEIGDVDSVDFFLDSKLVVEQVSGRWKVKQDHIKPLHAKIISLLMDIGCAYSFSHVAREKNSEADRLANMALDSL